MRRRDGIRDKGHRELTVHLIFKLLLVTGKILVKLNSFSLKNIVNKANILVVKQIRKFVLKPVTGNVL